MKRWQLALGIVTAALVVHATGCVMVVPPIEHGGQCAFSGATACAACLRVSCQSSINACCNDSSCNGGDGHSAVLDAVDACGNGNVSGCAEGIGDAESGTAGAVRTCVTTACRADCLGDVVVPVKWSCAAPRTEDNACATCVYDACGSTLDECCADSACAASSSLADDVGRCTSGDAPGCAYLTTKSTSGFEGKARACIIKSCASACMGEGRTHESCDLYSGGSYCECTDAEKSHGPDCSVASMGGNCVLGEKGCTCGHYACEQASSSLGGCTCSFRSGSGGSTRCDVERKNDEGVCCVRRESSGFTCECRTYLSSCLSNTEWEVPTCNIEDALSALTNVLVSKCSN